MVPWPAMMSGWLEDGTSTADGPSLSITSSHVLTLAFSGDNRGENTVTGELIRSPDVKHTDLIWTLSSVPIKDLPR